MSDRLYRVIRFIIDWTAVVLVFYILFISNMDMNYKMSLILVVLLYKAYKVWYSMIKSIFNKRH